MVTTTAANPAPAPSRVGTKAGSATLAGEHARIMLDVRRRAASVLTLVSQTHCWPHAELITLTRYLRTSVARQATEEEAILYPNGASAPLAELTAEHVQLYDLTEQLDRADAECGPREELRALIEQLLRTLEHHLAEEQAVLAALPGATDPLPGVGADLKSLKRFGD